MHGVAIWSSEAWRTAAVEWIDDQGVERTGEVEQPHLRPWATVLRVPTRNGPLWFKACSADTAFEAALYELLARVVPDKVLVPLAVDVERAWILLPDGGTSLGETTSGSEQLDGLQAAFVRARRSSRGSRPRRSRRWPACSTSRSSAASRPSPPASCG